MVRTQLGFGTKGGEKVTTWVVRPGHTRAIPIETIVRYTVRDGSLTQVAPVSTRPFAGLGLAVQHDKAGVTLTSTYKVHGQRLVLLQARGRKAVALARVAGAGAVSAPPQGPPGGIPGPH